MREGLFRKGLVIGLIVLFLGASTLPLGVSRTNSIKFTTEKAAVSDQPCESTDIVTVTDASGSTANDGHIVLIGVGDRSCVPSIVKRGDIAFCDNKPWTSGWRNPGYADDHALMYAGNNRFIEATAIFPWIYNGSKGWDLCKLGVLNTSICFLKLWATNIIYGQVINASESQRDAAVKWAESQRGHPDQYGFNPPWPLHKHEW